MTTFYLTEIVWAEDSKMTQPLETRLLGEFSAKSPCDQAAETLAKAHDSNGFDSVRDAWWGKSEGIVHYYHETTSKPAAS